MVTFQGCAGGHRGPECRWLHQAAHDPIPRGIRLTRPHDINIIIYMIMIMEINIIMISTKIKYWRQPLLPQGRGEKHQELREVARGRVERCKVAKDICLFVWLFNCLIVWLFFCLIVCLFVCLFVEEELRCTVNGYKKKQLNQMFIFIFIFIVHIVLIGDWGSPTIRIFEGRCLDVELRQEAQGKSTSLR